MRKKGSEKADKLTTNWLAQHLSEKGLKEMTKELLKQGLSKEVLKKTEAAEIQNNWQRLRGFMGGRR